MPDTAIGRKALALGYRRGYAKGLSQGMRRGQQRGIKEGWRRGVIDGMRQVITRQIKQRFGPPPATLQRWIESIAEARTLERIASGLAKAKDLDQLKKLVAGSKVSSRPSAVRVRPEGPARAVDWRRPRRQPPIRRPH